MLKKSGFGIIDSNVASGAILLKGHDGKVVRASFGEAAGSGPSVSVPSGEYAMVGYRLYRKDSGGTPWILSVGAPSLRKVTVPDGGSVRLDLDQTIAMSVKLASNGQVQMMASGPGHARSGATIYKNGKRIPMGYRVLSADGKALREGSITYG